MKPSEIARLRASLERGSRKYDQGGRKNQLDGAHNQLAAVVRWFTYDQGIPEDVVPLEHLLLALEGLTSGHRDPILSPEPISNAPPTAMHEQGRRASAAAAMSLLILAGLGKGEAARIVARRISSAGSEEIVGKTVANWRNSLKCEKPQKHHGAFWYRRLIKQLPAHFAGPREAGEFLLRHSLDHFAVVLKLAKKQRRPT